MIKRRVFKKMYRISSKKIYLFCSMVFLCRASLAAGLDKICVKSASEKCFTESFLPISSGNALKIFDHVTEISSKCFYDQTFGGLNWTKEIGLAREKLSDESTDSELKRVLDKLLGKLRASHTQYLTMQDQRFWELKAIFTGDLDGAKIHHIGATFKNLSGKWFVHSVFESSPAYKAGIRRGDEIVSVDDKTLSPVDSFSKINHGDFVNIKIRTHRNVQTKVVRIRPVYQSFQRAMFEGTKASLKIFLVHGLRIGYFHLWAGTHDSFKEELKKVAYILEQSADAMILDLRDGLGGANQQYLDPFLKSRRPIFSKPMYVLINDGVRSGKETLAYILKNSGRAVLIGTNTAGAYLGGRLFDITVSDNALYLAICGDSPVGVTLERVGVAPDIKIPLPLTYSHGADPQVDKALELAVRNLKAT